MKQILKKIVMSDKESMVIKGAFLYLTGYDCIGGIRPLHLRLPQMNEYVKYFKDTKYMNLLVHDKELLKKYNEIWDKIKHLLKKRI